MKHKSTTSTQVLSEKKHLTVTSILSLALIAVVIGTVSPPALADGGFVSALTREVTAPEQKVAISWNGEMETMILATKVRSKEIGDMGWIIPIKAIEKPEVELGDIKIFYDLGEYFGTNKLDWTKKKGTLGGGPPGFESIQILEEKELDIYDITVLKATDTDQFQKWLQVNGFRTNQASKKVLRSYTNDAFFLITVKIDLSNKYKGNVRQLQLGLYTPLKISFKCNEAFFPLKISSINPGNVNIVAYIFAKNPQKDKSGLLEVFKWQPLTGDFRLRTLSYLPVSDLSTVTKLTFKGPSSKFTEDVFFTDMTIWGKYWCLSKHYKQVDFSSLSERILFDAAKNGDVEALKRAVNNGVDVNTKGGELRHTPLYVAANGGHIKAVEFLIDKGADIDPKGFEDKTPLHVAAYGGNREMAKFLIDYGANVNARNKFGRTPLHFASEKTIELLVSSGADINARDNRGKTPLHEAALYGYKAKAKLLIALGADINAPDKVGRTPLHEAGMGAKANVAGVLIASGADLNPKSFVMPPSDLAIHVGWINLGEILKQVEEVKSVDSLHGACWRGNIEEVRAYISEGSDVNAKYKLGRSALHIAAALGYEEILELLISKGADIDAQDQRGWTALHEATIFGHEDIARILLKGGANARIQNNRGLIPVEVAERNSLTSGPVWALLQKHLENEK